MITYHQIKSMLQKLSILAGQLRQLRTLIARVTQLSEEVNSLNDELGLDHDMMTRKIRDVEELETVLMKHFHRTESRNSQNGAGEHNLSPSI